MASLEGKVGEPRPKDVHTVIDGLWHKPTTLNNVETWANVPAIILNGSDSFAAKGSKGSKGTKILALTGHIKNTGLIEVEMGTSLNTVVFDIGGGAANGKLIKAVQTGGPSGGCLPLEKFDLPVDFDTLAQAGSMVGSGGIVVMNEETCMVDVAKYFLTFLQNESCGKCVPCRLGIDRMLEIVTDISEGRGTREQVDLLEDLADTVSQTALCGLGRTASNPVLSTPAILPGGIRGPYRSEAVPGRCVSGLDHLFDRPPIYAPAAVSACGPAHMAQSPARKNRSMKSIRTSAKNAGYAEASVNLTQFKFNNEVVS